MENVIIYIVSFTFIYLIYFFVIINREKKRNLYRKSTEVLYLEKKYKLNIDKINMKELAHLLSLANAFIIANVVLIISFVDSIILKMLLGFVVLIPMIIIVYHLIGTYYKKKEVK